MSLIPQQEPQWTPPPKQRGSIRRKEIYISPEVYWLLDVRAKGLSDGRSDIFTADQFADDILRQWCRENLPNEVELLKLWQKKAEHYQQARELDAEAIKLAAKQKDTP